jgi:methyl-accepting chemotaxis protein
MAKETEAVRNNYYFLVCHIVFQAIVMLAYLIEVLKGARTEGYYGILAVIVAATVVAECSIFKKDRESKLMRHVAGAGFGLMYMYVLFTAANPLIFVYAVPMLVLITLFADAQYCLILAIGMMLINVGDAVRRIIGGLSGQDMEEIEIQVLSLGLYAIFTYICSRVTIINNNEKLTSIRNEQEQVQKLLDTVIAISSDMNTAIKDISDATETLKQSSEETMSAMR